MFLQFTTFLLVLWAQLSRAFGELVVFDANNPVFLTNPAWNQATSSAGTYLRTKTLGRILNLELPANASFIAYRGYKRPKGSLYGFCMDCKTSMLMAFVDGYDPLAGVGDKMNLSTIWSSDIDPTTQHALTLLNFPDSRFGATSELTFHSLVVNITSSRLANFTSDEGEIANFTPPPPPSSFSTGPTTTPPTETNSMTLITISSSPNDNDSHHKDKNSKRLSRPAIAVITVLVVFSAFSIGAALFLLYRRRWGRSRGGSVSSEFFSDPLSPGPTPVAFPSAATSGQPLKSASALRHSFTSIPALPDIRRFGRVMLMGDGRHQATPLPKPLPTLPRF